MQDREDGHPLRTAGMRVSLMVLIQVMAGFANIYLLAPIWMQFVHLLTADLLWIALVLLVCEDVSAWPNFSRPTSPSTDCEPASIHNRVRLV
jgi:heme A synthase